MRGDSDYFLDRDEGSVKTSRAYVSNLHLLYLLGLALSEVFQCLTSHLLFLAVIQGDPYGHGKDYVDIKFKVPSQAWVAGQPYS